MESIYHNHDHDRHGFGNQICLSAQPTVPSAFNFNLFMHIAKLDPASSPRTRTLPLLILWMHTYMGMYSYPVHFIPYSTVHAWCAVSLFFCEQLNTVQ